MRLSNFFFQKVQEKNEGDYLYKIAFLDYFAKKRKKKSFEERYYTYTYSTYNPTTSIRLINDQTGQRESKKKTVMIFLWIHRTYSSSGELKLGNFYLEFFYYYSASIVPRKKS